MTTAEVHLGDAHADIVDHDTYLDDVPHATFALLRKESPVSWIEEKPPNSGFWAVTKYDDVGQVSRDHETFTTRGIRLEEMASDELEARRTMMEFDPPEHTRLRRHLCLGAWLARLEVMGDPGGAVAEIGRHRDRRPGATPSLQLHPGHQAPAGRGGAGLSST